jgi:hypothetical protein
VHQEPYKPSEQKLQSRRWYKGIQLLSTHTFLFQNTVYTTETEEFKMTKKMYNIADSQGHVSLPEGTVLTVIVLTSTIQFLFSAFQSTVWFCVHTNNLNLYDLREQGQLSRYSDCLRARRQMDSEFETWKGHEFSLLQAVKTGSMARPASYSVGTGRSLSGVLRIGREANHSLQLVPRSRKRRSTMLTFTPHMA